MPDLNGLNESEETIGTDLRLMGMFGMLGPSMAEYLDLCMTKLR